MVDRPVHTTLALTRNEQAKLAQITSEIPDDVRLRYKRLVAKRRAETLTQDEYEELVHLSDSIEGVEVKRLEYLAELAKRRNTSLSSLMDALKITSPSYE